MVDILIIGAGATGAAASWSLSSLGLRVMCMEQGDFINPANYPTNSINWESQKLGEFNPSPNVRNLKSDYPINDSESPIGIANYNAVGGGTILYSGHFPRFHPSDFKVKTLDGVADDWPISYNDLEPYFSLNDSMMGVSGLTGDTAYPLIEGLLPPLPLGHAGEVMAMGFNKLGWHWWPSYSAIITKRYRGREPCINVGPCNLGCPQGAKSSVDITYWPAAIKNGVILKTNSRVCKIITNSNKRVTGVTYFDGDGILRRQEAKIVILACNGVGTPRLLLNSANEFAPNGLGNSSGLVGKNLMLHPLGYVEGLFSKPLGSHLGPQGCCIYSHEFYETKPDHQFMRGYTMQILRGSGPMEAALSGLLRNQIKFGSSLHESVDKTFGHNIGMGLIVEDLPELHNAVTLDNKLKDANGIPAPKISYQLSENSRKMMAHALSRGVEAMKAAGSFKEFAFGPVRETGWHLMGTARMGINPKTSVVNNKGQSHDFPNLFIVDSSVFVTSGAVNPVSTMQAIALYISDNLKIDIKQILGD